MLARVWVATCAAVLALLAASGEAEAAPVLRIDWPSLPGCPSSSVVLAHARAAIVRAKQVDDVLAVAEITPPSAAGAAWHLDIRTRTVRGTGERSLEAPTCDAIARAAGLFVALAALRTQAPVAELPFDELLPSPTLVEAPDPGVVEVMPLRWRRPRPPPPPPGPDVRVHVTVAAGPWITFGLLPNLAIGPIVLVGAEWRAWSARFGFMATYPREGTSGDLGARIGSFDASLDLCHRLPLPELLHANTRACAGATLDELHARGSGGTETFEARRISSMAFGGLGASWELGHRLRIGADARLGVSLLRPRFIVDSSAEGERVLHRPSALRAEGTVTFGVVF